MHSSRAVFPSPVVAGDGSGGSKRPGTLPESCDLEPASRDLLHRLLDPEPTRRLRSLRVLQTIAFYMKFDFEEVKMKKTNLRELLHLHFPDGPLQFENLTAEIEGFDSNID